MNPVELAPSHRLVWYPRLGAYPADWPDERFAAGYVSDLAGQVLPDLMALRRLPSAPAPRLRQALRRCTQEAA